MIVIFSEVNDQSTNDVIEWLMFNNQPHLRINRSDTSAFKFHKYDSESEELVLGLENKEISLRNISSVWFRRVGNFSRLLRMNINYNYSIFKRNDSSDYIKKHHQREIESLLDFVQFKLETVPQFVLSKKSKISLNKLQMLDTAKKFGLSVPKSVVSAKKKTLKDFIKTLNKNVITKALSDGVYHFAKDNAYYTYTERVKINHLREYDESMFPSLLQEETAKSFELRIFYLEKEFYSMAIFSQLDKNTSVDMRKSATHPKRQVPYKLPSDIEDKLRRMMLDLDLNSGSIDMLVTPNEEYVFLEVNPVGQFGMLSRPCNYQLEKIIATLLSKNIK